MIGYHYGKATSDKINPKYFPATSQSRDLFLFSTLYARDESSAEFVDADFESIFPEQCCMRKYFHKKAFRVKADQWEDLVTERSTQPC